MARTTTDAFNTFRSALPPTLAERATIATRKETVSQQLGAAFRGSNMPVVRVDLIGSADRGTIIRPPSDIDILAWFDGRQVWSTYRFNSQTFLYRVTEALERHTRVSIVGARGQAARLFYASGPHVDVAPVFSVAPNGFALPDGRGGWITTDPHFHDTWSARRNGELDGSMKTLVRMLKAWNRAHSHRLSSFHLEVMVASIFSSLDSRNLREAGQMFFDYAPGYLHVQDPAGHGGDLAAGLSRAQEQAIYQSFNSSAERAGRARLAEAAGDHRESIRLWKIVYGAPFPSYG